MDRENIVGLMVGNILGIMLMIRNMDLECIVGQMGKNIEGIGVMDSRMERVYMLQLRGK